jgi:ribosomal protein S18 acetylase RimI-like enzyme
MLRVLHPVGQEYLHLATRLLQSARLAEPEGGLWEAADLAWWWRGDQHADPEGQSIWLDGDVPIVAAVFTRWRETIGFDLHGTDAAVAEHTDVLWDRLGEAFTGSALEMIIRDDDPSRIAAAERAGFEATDDRFATGWMDAASRPQPPSLPDGMRIASYAGGPHPMVARNGEHVARLLAECSLYRADLDLAVRDGDTVAGYALFWADPVTGVGLLEPMRIEDAYQGRGLGKALIAAGLDRLAAAGCTRLKVSYQPSNEPAARLYTGAGYRPGATSQNWVRPARA